MKRNAVKCAVGLAALLTACLDPFEPDVGPLHAETCVDEDSDPDAEVSFAVDIRAGIIANRCLACHSPNGETPIGFEIGGLDLSSYTTLRAGGVLSGADIVMPASPCSSVISQKIGEFPPFGARMPLSGPPFLSAAEQQLIRDWIAEGAGDN